MEVIVRGKIVLIDDQDRWMFRKAKWRLGKDGYVRSSWFEGKRNVSLHRVIAKPATHEVVDHANRNILDNRRCNLRLCSMSENLINRPAPKQNTSGVKGVNWDKQTGRWRAKLQARNKSINIGRFKTIEEAKSAYNAAAKQHFGEFAWINP